MAVAVLDDHLLRDWLVGPDPSLRLAIGHSTIATTNLWYSRLCKSALTHGGGALLGSWGEDERREVMAGLLALPDSVTVVPMVSLAWRMGELMRDYRGLSTLGAEAVAAAESTRGQMLVSGRDDGPGIRSACHALGIRYTALSR